MYRHAPIPPEPGDNLQPLSNNHKSILDAASGQSEPGATSPQIIQSPNNPVSQPFKPPNNPASPPVIPKNKSHRDGPSKKAKMTLITLISANITSLRKNWDLIRMMNANIYCLQETTLNPQGQNAVARTIHKSGHNVLFSKPSEYKLSGLQKTFSLWNARSGGLATISKQALPIQNIPATNTDFEHSRCTHTWIPAGCGLRGFHLFNVYGYVGSGKKNPYAFQQNDNLLQQIFQSVALSGHVPWLIVGDFQTNPSESPTLGSMCSNNFAYDLGELFTESTWTFQKGDNENIRTRIDLAICNDVMLHHVVDVDILRDLIYRVIVLFKSNSIFPCRLILNMCIVYPSLPTP